MRIIGGTARGRQLKTLRGLEVRPTSDKVREALFDILGQRVSGATFLDLFAGSGAVGIEALSRGAELAVFIEKDPRCVRIIQENLEQTGFSSMAEVLRAEAAQGVEYCSQRDLQFDIVFADPPYNQRAESVLESLLESESLLKAGAVVVWERATWIRIRSTTLTERITAHYHYGDTMLSLFRREL